MNGKPIPLRIAHAPSTEPALHAVEAVLDYLNLPTAREPLAREDGVHVVVNGGDAFAMWVHALGGEITEVPALDGASLYTLRTETPRRADGSTVPIRVHVALVDGEFGPGDVRGQVSA